MGSDRDINLAETLSAVPSARSGPRWVESLALFLLLLGAPVGFMLLGGWVAAVVGWLVGVGLLWCSTAWAKRDKVLGTLAFPGGLLPLLLALLLGNGTSTRSCSWPVDPETNAPGPMTCVSDGPPLPWPLIVAILVALLVVPILTVAHLDRRRGGSQSAAG